MNDTLGHVFGDLMLAEVARRLRQTLRGSDTLAQLSGDEFVIICENLAGSPAQIARWLHALGRRIRIDLCRPPRGTEMELVVSVSIGTAITTQPRTAEDLLAEADRAMHRAKQRGGGRLVISTVDAARSLSHSASGWHQLLLPSPDHGRGTLIPRRAPGQPDPVV
jgi:diguanylate cyclase (GGDEF)-like protein